LKEKCIDLRTVTRCGVCFVKRLEFSRNKRDTKLLESNHSAVTCQLLCVLHTGGASLLINERAPLRSNRVDLSCAVANFAIATRCLKRACSSSDGQRVSNLSAIRLSSYRLGIFYQLSIGYYCSYLAAPKKISGCNFSLVPVPLPWAVTFKIGL